VAGEPDRQIQDDPGAGARGEDDDAVADVDALVDVVGEEHDGRAVGAVDLQEQVLQLFAGLGVEGTEGLVHQEEGGAADEGAGDGAALLHSAGELPGMAAGGAGQADALEDAVGLVAPFGAG
jgi:hypothetical protein